MPKMLSSTLVCKTNTEAESFMIPSLTEFRPGLEVEIVPVSKTNFISFKLLMIVVTVEGFNPVLLAISLRVVPGSYRIRSRMIILLETPILRALIDFDLKSFTSFCHHLPFPAIESPKIHFLYCIIFFYVFSSQKLSTWIKHFGQS